MWGKKMSERADEQMAYYFTRRFSSHSSHCGMGGENPGQAEKQEEDAVKPKGEIR